MAAFQQLAEHQVGVVLLEELGPKPARVIVTKCPTLAVGSSQAPPASVDNSAPVQPARCLLISWGKTVQRSGDTSVFLYHTAKPALMELAQVS